MQWGTLRCKRAQGRYATGRGIGHSRGLGRRGRRGASDALAWRMRAGVLRCTGVRSLCVSGRTSMDPRLGCVSSCSGVKMPYVCASRRVMVPHGLRRHHDARASSSHSSDEGQSQDSMSAICVMAKQRRTLGLHDDTRESGSQPRITIIAGPSYQGSRRFRTTLRQLPSIGTYTDKSLHVLHGCQYEWGAESINSDPGWQVARRVTYDEGYPTTTRLNVRHKKNNKPEKMRVEYTCA